MSKVIRVFLSSVAKGLEEHRDAVAEALNKIDWVKCIRMEDFGARNEDSSETCLRLLRGCDAFVGIAGPRYGTRNGKTGKSFSEMEYDEATDLKLLRLMFLTEAGFPIPANLAEPESTRLAQAQFRKSVEDVRQVAYFMTSGDLVTLVQAALLNERNSLLPEAGRSGHSQQATTSQNPIQDLIDASSIPILSSSRGPRTPSRLIFPFVSNQASFDTGIAITNASAGPFCDKPQAGVCRITFFSSGPEKYPPQISVLVSPGEQMIFNLSMGNATCNIAPCPGFQGYLIAECDFEPCYGYAFLSSPTQGGLSSSYLAQKF